MSARIASTRSADILEAERDIRSRLDGRPFNFVAMSAVANIYRGGSSVRNHMERTILADFDLSWMAFTVLWVLWIWGEQETAHVAAEAGVSKGTLTGVVRTLAGRKLVRRIPHRDDRRRVSLGLSRAGERLIEELFPQFNEHESLALSALTAAEQRELSRLLRLVIHNVGSVDETL